MSFFSSIAQRLFSPGGQPEENDPEPGPVIKTKRMKRFLDEKQMSQGPSNESGSFQAMKSDKPTQYTHEAQQLAFHGAWASSLFDADAVSVNSHSNLKTSAGSGNRSWKTLEDHAVSDEDWVQRAASKQQPHPDLLASSPSNHSQSLLRTSKKRFMTSDPHTNGAPHKRFRGSQTSFQAISPTALPIKSPPLIIILKSIPSHQPQAPSFQPPPIIPQAAKPAKRCEIDTPALNHSTEQSPLSPIAATATPNSTFEISTQLFTSPTIPTHLHRVPLQQPTRQQLYPATMNLTQIQTMLKPAAPTQPQPQIGSEHTNHTISLAPSINLTSSVVITSATPPILPAIPLFTAPPSTSTVSSSQLDPKSITAPHFSPSVSAVHINISPSELPPSTTLQSANISLGPTTATSLPTPQQSTFGATAPSPTSDTQPLASSSVSDFSTPQTQITTPSFTSAVSNFSFGQSSSSPSPTSFSTITSASTAAPTSFSAVSSTSSIAATPAFTASSTPTFAATQGTSSSAPVPSLGIFSVNPSTTSSASTSSAPISASNTPFVAGSSAAASGVLSSGSLSAPSSNSFSFAPTPSSSSVSMPFGTTSAPAVSSLPSVNPFGTSSAPVNIFGSSAPAFGTSSNPVNPFGASSTSATAFSSSIPAFGTATQVNPFGAHSTPTTAFGTPSVPAIGTSSAPANAFGISATPTMAFGTSSVPAFGTLSTQTTSSVPANPFGPSSTPFGTSPVPAFGTPSAPATAFGISSTAAISSTPVSATAFGFGTSSTPSTATTFGTSSTPAFGTPSTPVPAATFGFGTSSTPATPFGASVPASAFGASSTPAFGISSTPAPASAFGTSSAPASGVTPFGVGSTSTASSFGTAPSFTFGASSATHFGASSGSFSTSAFGASAQNPTFVLKSKPRINSSKKK